MELRKPFTESEIISEAVESLINTEGVPNAAASRITSGALSYKEGKRNRSAEVIESIKQNGAVYFAAVGGAGALLSKCIKEAEVIAYDDLGTEAIRKLRVENFPVIVVIDSQGNNLYETAVENFKKLK